MASSLPAGDILLAFDSEASSTAAARWAMTLALAAGRRLVAVFVKDPYLKQFYNEIYAQGRQEYLDHVDRCNDELAEKARDALVELCQAQDLAWELRVRHGDPAEELAAEAGSGGYALLVIDAGKAAGRWSRQPDGLGRRLAATLELPVLVVP